MAADRSYVEKNRAQRERLRGLVARLSDDDLCRSVGDGWTVSVVLAHMAFWDRRVLHVLNASEQQGSLAQFGIDIVVNDISTPLWAAIPPREAVRLALESADDVDQKLEKLSPELLEQVAAFNQRYVLRTLHRSDHLDQIEQGLQK